MQVAFFSLPTSWGPIQNRFVSSPTYAPLWGTRLRALASRHHVTSFPRLEDEQWALDEVLLCPTFYTQVCRPRIESAPESRRGDESWVMARILCEGAPDLVRAIAEQLSASTDATFARRLTRAYAAWRYLEEILCRAFPRASSLLPALSSPASVRDAELSQHADDADTNALLDLFHRPRYLDALAEIDPRVVFIVGDFPAMLPVAVAYAARLRRRLPRASLVLYQAGADIYASLAQTLPSLTRARTLFDYVDGAMVYQDLQDLTLCQILETLATGTNTLEGVENLVCKVDGRIVYREPERATVSDYLEHTHLDNLMDALAGVELQQIAEKDVVLPQRAKLFPSINATKQTCYWDRCHFCSTSGQSWIRRDPLLDRRAEETAALLSELHASGAEMTFVGREVVPPRVLKNVVATLRDRPDPPPWSYEGKFDTFYDQAFIDDLARSGCRGIIFGLESPSDRLNQRVDKHREGVSVRTIERVVSALDTAGVAVHVNTIYDLPGSTRQELAQHERWLARMFDQHQLFHFNTNALRVFPGSHLATHPEDHGLKIDATDPDHFLLSIPFHRDTPAGSHLQGSGRIWTEVFGSSWFDGCPLEQLHMIYHESTCCAFWDAAAGRNLFKEIQTAIGAYTQCGDLAVEVADSVQVVASDSANGQWVWLVDVGKTAGWVRLPSLLWQIVETSMAQNLPLDGAIDAVAPTLSESQRRLARRTMTRLLARGILTSRL